MREVIGGFCPFLPPTGGPLPEKGSLEVDPGPLVLYASRRRSLQITLLGFVVAAIGLGSLYVAIVYHFWDMVWFAPISVMYLLRGPFAIVDVGGIVSFRKPRTVTVDDRGILLALGIDRSPWLIEWGEIQEVFVSCGADFTLPLVLGIVPKSRDTFGQSRSSGERRLMEKDWEQYGAAVTVRLDLFTQPEGEVQDLLLAACRTHGVCIRDDVAEEDDKE